MSHSIHRHISSVALALFSICMFNGIIAMDRADFHYDLSVKKLSNQADAFKITVTQELLGANKSSQTCSFVADFITQSITNEQNLFAPFHLNKQSSLMFANPNHPNHFVYSIPDFGLLKLHRDGSLFFGHGTDEAPLAHHELTLDSSGKLFLETLKVAGLHIQSPDAQLCETIITNQLRTDKKLCNKGKLQTKQLLGAGDLINEGSIDVQGETKLTNATFTNKGNFVGQGDCNLIAAHVDNQGTMTCKQGALACTNATLKNNGNWLMEEMKNTTPFDIENNKTLEFKESNLNFDTVTNKKDLIVRGGSCTLNALDNHTLRLCDGHGYGNWIMSDSSPYSGNYFIRFNKSPDLSKLGNIICQHTLFYYLKPLPQSLTSETDDICFGTKYKRTKDELLAISTIVKAPRNVQICCDPFVLLDDVQFPNINHLELFASQPCTLYGSFKAPRVTLHGGPFIESKDAQFHYDLSVKKLHNQADAFKITVTQELLGANKASQTCSFVADFITQSITNEQNLFAPFHVNKKFKQVATPTMQDELQKKIAAEKKAITEQLIAEQLIAEQTIVIDSKPTITNKNKTGNQSTDVFSVKSTHKSASTEKCTTKALRQNISVTKQEGASCGYHSLLNSLLSAQNIAQNQAQALITAKFAQKDGAWRLPIIQHRKKALVRHYVKNMLHASMVLTQEEQRAWNNTQAEWNRQINSEFGWLHAALSTAPTKPTRRLSNDERNSLDLIADAYAQAFVADETISLLQENPNDLKLQLNKLIRQNRPSMTLSDVLSNCQRIMRILDHAELQTNIAHPTKLTQTAQAYAHGSQLETDLYGDNLNTEEMEILKNIAMQECGTRNDAITIIDNTSLLNTEAYQDILNAAKQQMRNANGTHSFCVRMSNGGEYNAQEVEQLNRIITDPNATQEAKNQAELRRRAIEAQLYNDTQSTHWISVTLDRKNGQSSYVVKDSLQNDCTNHLVVNQLIEALETAQDAQPEVLQSITNDQPALTNVAPAQITPQSTPTQTTTESNTTFTHPSYTNCFLWSIPDFGLLKLHKDGSLFFGHSANEAPLANHTLTLNSSGKLFLETLKTTGLHIKSADAQLCETIITNQLCADQNVRNSGGFKTKQLLGQGNFINEALVEFESTEKDPALLGIKTFQNKKSKQSLVEASVTANHLRIMSDNQKFENKKNSKCDIGHFALDKPHDYQSHVHNKGILKINELGTNREIINDGSAKISGNITLTNTSLINNSDMVCKQGNIACTNAQLKNNGDWLIEGMRNTDPFDIKNKGILELKDSSLNFNHLINKKDLIFKSGIYTLKQLGNHTMQLLDNDWTITDLLSATGPNTIKFVTPAEHIRSRSYFGDIECQHNLKYDIAPMPHNLTVDGDLCFLNRHIRDIHELTRIKTSGKVSAHCKPISLLKTERPQSLFNVLSNPHSIEFPNINHLHLSVYGPVTIHGSLKAPALTLSLGGPLKVGKDNNNLGTIAATDGPLKIYAHDIDGRYGKFYGKKETWLESTRGDITLGAPARGVDEDIKKQFLASPVCQAGDGTPWGHKGHPCSGVISWYLPYLAHTLDVPNGAYAASGGGVTLRSAANISLDLGTIDGIRAVDLRAPKNIENIGGKISSHGPIWIQSDTYTHGRKGQALIPLVSNYSYFYYPGSGPAKLESLDIIKFMSNKIHNIASSIRSGKGLFIGNKALEKGSSYTEDPLTFVLNYFNEHGWGGAWGWQSCPLLNQACTTQSGGDIQMNTGDLTITGNMHAAGKLGVHANTALFANTSRTRNTINPTAPIVANVTQSMQHKAQQPGMYQLGANGSVQTEFELAKPSQPQAGHCPVLLENPEHPTPLNWQNIFNPLSSINLDLHLQQLLANLAGKVSIGNAQGNNIATALWANADDWRQKHGITIMTQQDLQQLTRSMLLSQIVRNGATEQQHLLLCIAPNDINPYQEQGDTVAEAIEIETIHNQTHQNNRVVANGPEGVKLTSTQGDINLETQSYTVLHDSKEQTTIQQIAMPQQQVIAHAGLINTTAHNNVTRTGTAMIAAGNVTEHAQTGTLSKKPLVLQTTVQTREEDDGWFSSSTTTSTSVTHEINPCITIANATLHDKAGTAINAVAVQDQAGQEIIYESPNTTIEGIIVADRFTKESTTSSVFSEQSSRHSKETPCAVAANIQAPLIRLVGDNARINANISGTELRDETTHGAQFVAKVAAMLCSGQTLVDSPFMSVDAGYEAMHETMIQPMLMVERIVRAQNNGQMLFESAIIDKNRTEIIGNFVETTYQLKQWQREWNDVSQLVPTEALVVVAFAIAVATQGAGVKFLAPMLKSVTAATGMQLSAAGIAAVNAGFSAICASTGASFLRTGDPLQTVQQQFSKEQLKSIAFKMASAGLCAQLGEMLNVNMAPDIKLDDALQPEIIIKDFTEHLSGHAIQSTVDTLLNVAINHASVDKALGDAVKQIPLKAAASYAADKISVECINDITRKAAHTTLGGLSGFAIEQNRDGFVSGAVGALTAQTVGDILVADAKAISAAARERMAMSEKPMSVQQAIALEVESRTKLAKIAGGAAAVLVGKNPSIAIETASNAVDHDVAIRGQLYALKEFQAMVAAASQAMATISTSVDTSDFAKPSAVESETKKQETPDVQRTQKSRSLKSKAAQKQNFENMAHDLTLHNIEKQSDVNAYGDIILEHAHETLTEEFNSSARDLTLDMIHAHSNPNKHDDVILEHAHQKHMSEIKQRELWGIIKDDNLRNKFQQRAAGLENIIKNPSLAGLGKYLLHGLKETANDTMDLLSWIPSFWGMACFAGSTGRDLHQGKTTAGEVAFNLAAGYGILKGIQYTGRGIKFVYQQGKDTIKDVTNKIVMPKRVLSNVAQSKAARETSNFAMFDAKAKDIADKAFLKQHVLHNIAQSKAARETSNLPVPFVQNPRALTYTEATISDELVLYETETYNKLRKNWKVDPKAPFNVFGHGNSNCIAVQTNNIPRLGLSQQNLEKLLAYGKVRLNETQLLRLMRVSGYQKGQPINLSSCSTGAQPDGFAQKLANRAQKLAKDSRKVYVSAPTELLILNSKRFKVRDKDGKRGLIKTFHPDKVNKVKAISNASHQTSGVNPNRATQPQHTSAKATEISMNESASTQPKNITTADNTKTLSNGQKETALVTKDVVSATDTPQIHLNLSKLLKTATELALAKVHQFKYAIHGRVPFVKNPYAGVWQEATRAYDLILDKNTLPAYEAIWQAWNKHPHAPFNIFIHGNSTATKPFSVTVPSAMIHRHGLSQANLLKLNQDGYVDLTPVQLARLIYTSRFVYSKGQHINLFSCQSGALANGPAQQLANRMKVPVSAATENLILIKTESSPLMFGVSNEELNKFGMIKTFYPQKEKIIDLKMLAAATTAPLLLLSGDECSDLGHRAYYDMLKFINSNNREKIDFVENQKAGIWHSACFSNELVLKQKDAYNTFNAQVMKNWHKHPKCPFVIHAHGNTSSVFLENKEVHGLKNHTLGHLEISESIPLNTLQLADIIRNNPDYKEGQHIHLFSCENGMSDDGIAQQLADEMNAPVSAYTGLLVITTDDMFFAVGEDDSLPSEGRTLKEWKSLINDGTIKTKEIKTFYPQKKTIVSDIPDMHVDDNLDG